MSDQDHVPADPKQEWRPGDVERSGSTAVADYINSLRSEIARYQRWIDDLQAGKYINCVYCGHRYGPDPGTPDTKAEVLKRHVAQCPKHPMAHLKRFVQRVARGHTVDTVPLLRAEAVNLLEEMFYEATPQGLISDGAHQAMLDLKREIDQRHHDPDDRTTDADMLAMSTRIARLEENMRKLTHSLLGVCGGCGHGTELHQLGVGACSAEHCDCKGFRP